MAKLPKFQSEQEESDFWDTHDSTEYLEDLQEIDAHFVDARPKTMISIRLEPELIVQVKGLARQKGIGYQTLMRIWLMERLTEETTVHITEINAIGYYKEVSSIFPFSITTVEQFMMPLLAGINRNLDQIFQSIQDVMVPKELPTQANS